MRLKRNSLNFDVELEVPEEEEEDDYAISPSVQALVDQTLQAESYYQVLEMRVFFDNVRDEEKLQRSYLEKSLSIGPYITLNSDCELAFKRIAKAYEILNTPTLRSEYDREKFKLRRIKRPRPTESIGLFQSFYMVADTLHEVIEDNELEKKSTLLKRAAEFLLWIEGLFTASTDEDRRKDGAMASDDHILQQLDKERARRKSIRKHHHARRESIRRDTHTFTQADSSDHEPEAADAACVVEAITSNETQGESETDKLKNIWKEAKSNPGHAPHNLKGKTVLRRIARVLYAVDAIISSVVSLGTAFRKERARFRMEQERQANAERQVVVALDLAEPQQDQEQTPVGQLDTSLSSEGAIYIVNDESENVEDHSHVRTPIQPQPSADSEFANFI